jgi:hypothetical protein
MTSRPLLAVGLFAAVFVGVCWLGTILSRPFVKPWFHEQSRLNEMLGDYLQYFGVIYGLLLGLLAVATYQNHTDVDKAVASEASSLATLYRDISAYPEPARTELKDLIREYPARPSKTPGRCSVRGSIRGRSIAPPQSTHGLLYLSLRPKGRRRSMRRCASSMSSSRIDGRAFSASPQASRPSCGTRSRLER